MGEQNRHTPQGKMEGGQDLFIHFYADANSSERPCSAEQRSTVKVSKWTNKHFYLSKVPLLGPKQVYSNSVCYFKPSPNICCSLGSLLLLGKSHLRGKSGENMVMVMIASGIPVLFLFTPSSIILVYLTLRLHFVAHYRGRGRWS